MRQSLVAVFLGAVSSHAGLSIAAPLAARTAVDPPPACSPLPDSACADMLAMWHRFAGPEAGQLLARGLEANTDIRMAIARLDTARAQARIAGARRAPSLGVTGTNSLSLAGSGTSPMQALQATTGQLSLAYEVDLFGAIRKGQRASLEQVGSARAETRAVALAICAQILDTYVRISALEAQAAMLDEQLDAAHALARVIDARAAEQEASAVERGLMAQQVSSLKVERAALGATRAQYQANLAVLLGHDLAASGPLADIPVVAFEALDLRALAAEQPLTQLDMRPDIQAAQSALRAARINVEAVRAAQLPGLRLSAGGLLGIVSGGLSTLASLATSLTANLFEGGAISGRTMQAQTYARLALAQYDKTRLVAAGEAVTALAQLDAAGSREASWGEASRTVERAARSADRAYLDGDLPFNLVIDTRRNAIATRRALIEARQDRLLAQIDVVRAMGGRPFWADAAASW